MYDNKPISLGFILWIAELREMTGSHLYFRGVWFWGPIGGEETEKWNKE